MNSFRKNYKLVIAYDGTNYSGWQIQPNSISIQELIQNAISTILRHPVNVIGSGRTDAGVHAIAQVAHFKCNDEIDLNRCFVSLNGILPKDIRIIEICPVPLSFHAQRSALRKTYHYHICLARVQNPFRRLYSLHVKPKVNIQLMEEAALYFLGKHDFTSFANEPQKGSVARNPIRTIERIAIVAEEDGLRLEFTGDGFLYKMVRTMVGTLLDVAIGKRDKDDITRLIQARDRRLVSQASPAHGLFLMHVEYPEEI